MTSADSSPPVSRRKAVAQNFGRRARDYSRHAHLQQHSAQTLWAFVQEQGGLPNAGQVVEIGCGTGLLTELLHVPDQAYLATDLSPEMLEQCRSRLSNRQGLSFAVLDGEEAAFASPPAAIVSNMACQWFDDPVAGIIGLARQTSFLAFSVPLQGSFPEWEAAFALLGRPSGLLPLPDEQAVLAALENLGARRIVHRVELRKQHFQSAKAFADSFRLIGAGQPRSGYTPAPIRPVLKRFASGLDATARILYCLVMRELE
jgi:malonyl-CoA O-methyltransferase